MRDLTEVDMREGLMVDILFRAPGPEFGDLFAISGDEHPAFPPSGQFEFGDLAELGFTQVDDYFGIRAESDEGDDVALWLYPLVQGEAVYHHEGPFDGVRLHFDVLRHPAQRGAIFVDALQRLSAMSGVTRTVYVNREHELEPGRDSALLRDDLRAAVQFWEDRGIAVGSDEALLMD